MDVSQFESDLRVRIAAAQEAFAQAERDEDYYAMDVRTGELKSLHRMAAENGVLLEPAENGPVEA
ncbi:hypothetical protein GCM10009789_32560 [Kribbella sancticallisti]|uniref:Uncharacterized protein n=1 Tax=Kribbella sancticallisti TaxID=460087 RepID=A0ABP4PGI7_9ACTN